MMEECRLKSFASSLGLDTIRIRFCKPDAGSTELQTLQESESLTTPNQRQLEYCLHVEKLKATSDYLKGLFSFNQAKVAKNEIVLDYDEFEQLFEAFDAFVELMYSGTFHDSNGKSEGPELAKLSASVFVLAERLSADGLRRKALEYLAYRFNDSDPGILTVDIVVEIVIIIYTKTHRPYKSDASDAFYKEFYHTLKYYGDYDEICAKCGARVNRHNREDTAPGEMTITCDARVGDEEVTQCGYQQVFREKRYDNNAARDLISEHCAKYLESYRRDPEFRNLLREYGEFAEDFLMQRIHTTKSDLVVVAELSG